MSGSLQDATLLSSCTFAEGVRRLRDTRFWAVLAVMALDWAGLIVAVFAIVMAGAAVRFGLVG